jgi:hypothetical protein
MAGMESFLAVESVAAKAPTESTIGSASAPVIQRRWRLIQLSIW